MRIDLLDSNPKGADPALLPALPAPAEWPVDRHPLAVYVASLASAHSRRGALVSARRALKALLERAEMDSAALDRFPWERLRYQHVAAIRARLLAQGCRPATVNVTLSHLRGILREAWRLGALSAEELSRVRAVAGVRGETLPAGRAVSAGELAALFRSCAEDSQPRGARDAALFAVLYAGGIRRAEAARLDLADYDRESGALQVRAGKGRKDRIVYVQGGGAEALEHWIELRGSESGALFQPVAKGGRIERRAMSPQAIRDACARRGRAAGVPHFTPHDLRRSFVSDLLDAGADVGSVQRLAGHAHVQTTLRYDRRPEAAKRRAASMLHVPYARERRG